MKEGLVDLFHEETFTPANAHCSFNFLKIMFSYKSHFGKPPFNSPYLKLKTIKHWIPPISTTICFTLGFEAGYMCKYKKQMVHKLLKADLPFTMRLSKIEKKKRYYSKSEFTPSWKYWKKVISLGWKCEYVCMKWVTFSLLFSYQLTDIFNVCTNLHLSQ